MKLFVYSFCIFVAVEAKMRVNLDDTSARVKYDTVNVEEIDYSNRHERSADELPDTMTLLLKSEKTNEQIRLRRASIPDISAIVCRHGQFKEIKVKPNKRRGIFIDETGNPLLVTRNGRNTTLDGNVKVDGKSLRVKVTDSSRHTLFSNNIMDMKDDGLKIPVENEITRKIKKARKARKARKQRKQPNRGKRQAMVNTVELLVVTDYAVKQRFLNLKNGDDDAANSELVLYYIFTTLGMQKRYETIGDFASNIEVNVEAVNIIISDTPDDSPFNSNNNVDGSVNYEIALPEFRAWVVANEGAGNIPSSDHVMWFTGDIIVSSQGSSVIGVAYVNAMCSDFSVSMVEDNYDERTEVTATHELGHSLGSQHDGFNTDCRENDFFIMAPSVFFPTDSRKTNPWQFSSCSVEDIEIALPFFSCLRSDDNSNNLVTDLKPGQYSNADDQCRLKFDDNRSFFCRNVQLNENVTSLELMCQTMFCFDPSANNLCRPIAAAEYTSCGDKMWCEKGDCVFSEDAPATNENCPQGDFAGFNCNVDLCSSYSQDQKAYCCVTCGSAPPPATPTSPPATSTPPPATSTPPPATSTPPPATSTPPPATSAPPPATSTPPPATSTPPPATSTPPPATSTPPPATSTPPPATSAPPPATSTPPPATSTPPPATSTPPPATSTPPPATSTPPPATSTPPPATSTPPPPLTPCSEFPQKERRKCRRCRRRSRRLRKPKCAPYRV